MSLRSLGLVLPMPLLIMDESGKKNGDFLRSALPVSGWEWYYPMRWSEWLKTLFRWLTLGRFGSIIEMIAIKLNRNL